MPYIDGMTGLMKNTDLMVTRAGASTLSEIIALRVPSILIPSPYVPNNHQYMNALDLVNVKAAQMIEEKNLSCTTLINKINEILYDHNQLKEMRDNLVSLGVNDSGELIYNSLQDLIERK